MTTGIKQNIDVEDVDVKNYIKFLLQEGDDQEKRNLFGALNSEIRLSRKSVEVS